MIPGLTLSSSEGPWGADGLAQAKRTKGAAKVVTRLRSVWELIAAEFSAARRRSLYRLAVESAAQSFLRGLLEGAAEKISAKVPTALRMLAQVVPTECLWLPPLVPTNLLG